MANRRGILLLQLLVCGLAILTWEIAGRISTNVFFEIGTPSAVMFEFRRLLSENLLGHFATTGSEALTGLIIGTALGASAGLGLWYSEKAAPVWHGLLLLPSALCRSLHLRH